MITDSTICAIATPPGNGAIAVIRVSGKAAFTIAGKIFEPVKQKRLEDQNSFTVHFGKIWDDDQILDEVLLTLFKAPRSYTGEDMVEISCHGSEYIQQRILNLLVRNGAELAQPGEFTLRAFLNGKLDLSQAEGVADLIASSSEASHKIAMQQMRGTFSDEINRLREQLLHFISLVELELDFSEEDVEFADRKKLISLLEKINRRVFELIGSFDLGNVIKKGIPVAIAGNPNVGKSTLLNLLLKDDRAIVSEIAGTTRDSIEDTININGITFRFIDTAGLRETSDTIESIGIKRTREKIEKAAVVLLLVDATDALANIDQSIRSVKSELKDQRLIIVINKIDLESKHLPKIYDLESVDREKDKIVEISAKVHSNIDKLTALLLQEVDLSYLSKNNVVVSNVRHRQALQHAHDSLQRALEGLGQGLPSDLMAQDIRQVLHYLGEITGSITTDEVLGNIFKNFCIGK